MTEIIFDQDGNARCIYSDAAAELLRGVGTIRTARASHVEPDGDSWSADLRPCGGPKLGPFNTRAEALEAEVTWLRENGIPLPMELRLDTCACGTGLPHAECCLKGHPR